MKKDSKPNWTTELIYVCKILKDNGIDIQKITLRKSLPNGKREQITIKDIDIDGIDIKTIIEKYELSADFEIGRQIRKFRSAYNGVEGNLSQEERELGESLGIVVKKNEKASPPIIKNGKISQFHVDFINGILDKLLNGKINNQEALKLLKQACIKNGEVVLSDAGSIRKCVEILLKDRPEDLELYNKTLKSNYGKRSRNVGKSEDLMFFEQEERFRKQVIEEYLPQLLNGTLSLTQVTKELGSGIRTINGIITDYYNSQNDKDGLRKYELSKLKNGGRSEEALQNAKLKRAEVSNYKIVSVKEFSFLSSEEQLNQLVMKIRLDQLQREESETDKTQTALTNEQSIKAKIESTITYFRSKNPKDSSEVYFTDQDIRLMCYRFPTLVSYSKESLDEKLEALTSCKEINKKTAYGMIKTFPPLMGYSVKRTQKQLDLLSKENLVDLIISRPTRCMLSVSLMYSLIEFAKERNHISNLSGLNASTIFISNSTAKRLYGLSHEDIQSKYPYPEQNQEMDEQLFSTISPNDIGKNTYNARHISNEATQFLKQVVLENERTN